MVKRMPAGWRRGHDETVACAHRDMSVCGECAVKYAANLIDVYGCHYFVSAEEKVAWADEVKIIRAEAAAGAVRYYGPAEVLV